MLFVNAGVKNDDRETIADVSTDEFVRVMVTNALSPMRVIEALRGVARSRRLGWNDWRHVLRTGECRKQCERTLRVCTGRARRR